MAATFRKTKYTCYYTYLAMSSVFCLPPILFMTFHEMYGISYTLLGTLVLVNFCTQLAVDLVFSFFSERFNIHKAFRTMPLLASLGLITYALVPLFFPQQAYVGLLAGTFLFSVGAGLNEVLLSSVVAALPSEHPEKDMSMLHSLYAWGVLMVVVVSSVFLKLFGTQNWMYLTMFWALLPVISFALFCTSPLPDMNLSHAAGSGSGSRKRMIGLALCVLCIFLGSAAENAMTNWISVYTESVLRIPKELADILGLALFAVLLGTVRTLYAKYGPDISKVLLISMAGATLCYLAAAFSSVPLLSMLACILTGLFTSMLWPGSLILMEEKFPASAVTAYALMAAGGDFGASVAPQMLGAVVDSVAVSEWGLQMSNMLAVTPEQLGMKVGMLAASLFPLLGAVLLVYMRRYFKKNTLS